jgi:hypothetical protein
VSSDQNGKPEYLGDSIEIDMAKRLESEKSWRMRTVHVGRTSGGDSRTPPIIFTRLWVRGPRLPDEVESDDNLTLEDRRDLTLDHIARTSDVVAHLEICKWG